MKTITKLLLVAGATALGALTGHAQSYSNAVMALNPVGYWPLNETAQPPPAYVATNYGTLGASATAYYDDPYPDSLGDSPYTLFGPPVPGVTSDGDAAASFNVAASGGDPSGYMIIPHVSQSLTTTVPFSVELWVEPLGGDPNDTSGASYSSTVWTSLIKEGYGGISWGDAFDANGDGAGWSISLSGIYGTGYPVGWYTPGPVQLLTNATWIVDFFNGRNGGSPSLEFDVPMQEPTPQWFHLVLTYDGTNAAFYTNGVLAATTVPGTPASTNRVWAPGNAPITSATGLYTFNTTEGVAFTPDSVNPIVLGNINTSGNFYGDGYPNTPDGTIGFNNQTYVGSMDEVAIYSSALSSATVAKHYSDAGASDKTLYTNDVLSLAPPVYLRLDEPAYTYPASSTFPAANNYGSMGSPANGIFQPGTTPGVAGPVVSGFGADYATRFNGLDAAVDVPNLSGSALDPSGNAAFSVAYWFKGNPADSYARFQSILGRGDSGWRSSVDGGGKLRWNPGAGPELTSAQNYNDGAWHQFVGVTDGTSDYLYVDGALSASNSPVGSLGGSAYDLFIGGAPDYTITKINGASERYFAGSIAQVAFFPTALNSSQIQTLYDSADLPASIVTQPAATTVIPVGENGSLSVTASGTPPFSYQWYQGTTKLSDSASYSGSTSPTLTILSAQDAQSGSYTVVVTNDYGAVTSAVSLVTIKAAPTIVQQPAPAATTLYAGNRVALSVGAVGVQPLSYQWYENGTAINGAAGTNYSAVATAGSNNYSVVVNNSFGSATSSVAAVTGVAFTPGSGGFAINYNDSGNGAYQGLGVYEDQPANTNWNLFPNPPGGTTAAGKDSAGSNTLTTLSMEYGFNNGASNPGAQGSPCFLVEYEAGVNANTPGAGTSANPMGTFTFHDVPPGVYTLYVYSANYDGNRGSVISLAAANGGQADGGTNATQNVQSDHSCDTMVEGDNYVFFHDVVPDANGTISGSYVPNPLGTLTGEGQIDALQLVLDQVTIQNEANGTVTLRWSGGTLQSAPSVTGPWTPVTGSSPQTVGATGQQQFYRVY